VKKILIILLLSTLATSAFSSEGFVDICDRGKIGEVIAKNLGAESCKKVNKTLMAARTRLFLNNSQISEIPENAFAGLASLTALFLSDNQISKIPENAFAGLASLTWLYLDDNQISKISENASVRGSYGFRWKVKDSNFFDVEKLTYEKEML